MPAPVLEYAKITGTIAIAVADRIGDPDENPDIVYADSGTVIFTPQVDHVRVPASTPPVLIVPKPITALVDSTGRITMNGLPEVYLLDLGSALVSPSLPRSQGAYRVDFNVSVANAPIPIASFFCNPSAALAANDIATMAPVASGAGQAIVVGPGVPTGGTGGQVLTKASDVDYDTEWTGGGIGSLSQVDNGDGTFTLVTASSSITETDNGDGTVTIHA